MNYRGRLVIALMFGVGLAMAGYAWWHEFRSNARCRDFWGRDATLTISRAPKVMFFLLAPLDRPASDVAAHDPVAEHAERIVIQGRTFAMTQANDVSRVPGLIHARYALSDDNSYIWHSTQSEGVPRWEFGLRFIGSGTVVTVVFDTQCDSMRWLEGNRGMQLVPVRAAAFQKKRADWLPDANKP